jgi:putative transcriptional regulator
MKDELFNDLEASVQEMVGILRGQVQASRVTVVDSPDVKRIRDGYHLSQGEFAAMLGISVKTLRNWEQGRRSPEGPARVLLRVAARHPQAVWDVVRTSVREPKQATIGDRRRGSS